jgi:hypothetical protein
MNACDSADAAAVFGGVLEGLSEYELILTVGEYLEYSRIECLLSC